MNSGLVTHSITSQRIESVNDPNLNKALFTLYEKLIPYFVEIENIQENIYILENSIEINCKEIKRFFSRVKKPGIIISIVAIVLLWISMISLEAKGVYVVDKLEQWYPFSNVLHFDWFFLGLTVLIIPMFIGFVPSLLISYIINDRIKKKNIEYKNGIKDLENQLVAKVDEIKDVACFVPKNYRNSKHLAFFVDAYANSKIDNLKEAVNLCDKAEYRQMSLDLQKEQIEKLSRIEFNQLKMSSQLDSLKRSVWFS